MKNQYVGDINDYQKYDLLQLLSKEFEEKILVVWMLTKDDGRTDGRKIDYLKNQKYSKYNAILFMELKKLIEENKRNVKGIEKLSIFNKDKFDFISDHIDTMDRDKYFAMVDGKIDDVGIIFFDPDNGFAPKKQNNPAKYLYWNEIKKYYEKQKDILVIQFFPRFMKCDRIEFTENKVKECMINLNINKGNIIPFYGKNVVFLYLSQRKINTDEILCEWGKWETGRMEIISEDGKKYKYSVDRDPNMGIGWGMGTVPITQKIYSKLYKITEEDVSSIYEYKDLIGNYFDKDGYIYVSTNNDTEIYRLFFPESLTKSYFENLYESKINGT
jgi:hypothetical protein